MKQNNLMDIKITNLACDIVIGIRDYERLNKQKIIFDIDIKYDASKAIESDKAIDVVDYWKISTQIIALANKTSYNLIETLIAKVKELILQDNRVIYCKVTIHKPKALEEFGALVSVSSSC